MEFFSHILKKIIVVFASNEVYNNRDCYFFHFSNPCWCEWTGLMDLHLSVPSCSQRIMDGWTPRRLDFVSSAKVMPTVLILWQQDGTESCASINPSLYSFVIMVSQKIKWYQICWMVFGIHCKQGEDRNGGVRIIEGEICLVQFVSGFLRVMKMMEWES